MTHIDIESIIQPGIEIPVHQVDFIDSDPIESQGILRPESDQDETIASVHSIDAQRAKKSTDPLLFKDGKPVVGEGNNYEGMPSLRNEAEVAIRGIGGTRIHTGNHSKYGHGPSYADLKRSTKEKNSILFSPNNPMRGIANGARKLKQLRERW